MHTVFAVIGWILLVLLIMILVLLFMPVQIILELKYDKFSVKFRFWFYTRVLYNAEDEEDEETVSETQTESQTTKKKKKPLFPFTLERFVEFISAASWLIKLVLKCIFVRGVKVIYPIHREDAAETAIAFGKTQAYVGAAIGTLQNALNLKLQKIDIIPDFNGEYKYQRYFYCKIQSIPFIMIIAAVYALVRLRSDKVI